VKSALLLWRLALNKRLVLPSFLFATNLGCAFSGFKARDWKHGVYYLSSALCIAMVALLGDS